MKSFKILSMRDIKRPQCFKKPFEWNQCKLLWFSLESPNIMKEYVNDQGPVPWPGALDLGYQRFNADSLSFILLKTNCDDLQQHILADLRGERQRCSSSDTKVFPFSLLSTPPGIKRINKIPFIWWKSIILLHLRVWSTFCFWMYILIVQKAFFPVNFTPECRT